MDKDIKKIHEELLYPCVRVRTARSGGSGTVIYSKPTPKDESLYETYVFTNHHVIADNIKVGKKWSPLLQRDVKQDILSDVDVEFFIFEYGSWEAGQSTYKAEIVAYDKDADIALLKLKSSAPTTHVAKMFPKGEEKERLRMFMGCYAIGCGLGHPPIATIGHLNCFTDIIENYPYWMQSGPIIYGNSGGAVFLQETNEYIGIPARVAISGGFAADAITHMSYFIPITTIYKFIDDNIFNLLYDPNYSSDKCYKIINKMRQKVANYMVGKKNKEDS
jgi:S1-C subfamily serine protease